MINQNLKINETFKVSLVISPKIDRPGLLFDIIKVFKEHHVNMTSIISRPNKEKVRDISFLSRARRKRSRYSDDQSGDKNLTI